MVQPPGVEPRSMASEATILSIELWLRSGVVIWLSVTSFKLFHEGNECVYASFREGVVDGGSHTANGAVAF